MIYHVSMAMYLGDEIGYLGVMISKVGSGKAKVHSSHSRKKKNSVVRALVDGEDLV